MSLFGKKGSSDDSESARQTAIKQLLNRELSTGIKKLQRDHIGSDSAIRSGDTANRICNVLEAIFLHELKDFYASKSFWLFIVKFTHNDVVQQIKTLSLINTEVGHCRAWIRMALNDSLMDSYVDAMLCDAKTIRTYYKRSSFLRDTEQPHIMKNYLQGLGNFIFQLSYNSSVINIWGAAPMIASGSWVPPRDSPVSEPGTPKGVLPGGITGLKHQYSDPTSSYHAPKAKQECSPLTDPETEVTEAIDGSFHECEISSALLHSLSDDDSPLVLPIAMDTESKNLASPHKEKGTKHGQSIKQRRALQETSMDTSLYCQQEQTSKEQQIHQQEFQNKEAKTAKITHAGPNLNVTEVKREGNIAQNLDKAYSFYNRNASSELKPPYAFDKTPAPNPFDQEPSAGTELPAESVENNITEKIGVINDDLPDCAETVGVDIHVRPSEDVVKQDTALTDKDSEFARKNIPFTLGRGGVLPVPSQATAAVKTDDNQRARPEENDRQINDFVESFQGNSLGARSGWSSSFEHHAVTPTGEEASLPASNPTSRTALASYKSLLEDYASQGTTCDNATTTLNDLLGQFPSREECTPLSTPKEGRHASTSSSVSEMDISLEFEVIPFSSSPTSKYADTRTQSLLNMVTVIGREKGLDSQNYQCNGCSRPVGIIYGKANVCSYDGGYYCYECHTDDEAIIPAKILYSWDFRKHKVSKYTKVFLQQIEAMPLIDVDECNSTLYKAIPELAEILILRSQLKYLKAYLFTCQQSVAEDLRKKVWPREYMLDHMHLYSVQDFLQIQGGNLAHFLKRVIIFAAKHVQQCALCSQKGFICEICNSEKVIYPFDVELTVRCEKCTTVFHKLCKIEMMPCPKCERRRLRKTHPQFHESQDKLNFATPFT